MDLRGGSDGRSSSCRRGENSADGGRGIVDCDIDAANVDNCVGLEELVDDNGIQNNIAADIDSRHPLPGQTNIILSELQRRDGCHANSQKAGQTKKSFG